MAGKKDVYTTERSSLTNIMHQVARGIDSLQSLRCNGYNDHTAVEYAIYDTAVLRAAVVACLLQARVEQSECPKIHRHNNKEERTTSECVYCPQK